MKRVFLLGARLAFIVGSFLLCLSVPYFINSFKSDSETLEQLVAENQYYTATKKSGPMVVDVQNIYETSIALDNKQFYLIQTDQGYVYLEAQASDKAVVDLLKQKANDSRIVVSWVSDVEKSRRSVKYNISSVLTLLFKQNYKRLTGNQDESLLHVNHYLSISRYQNSSQMVMFASGFGILLGILALLSGVYKVRKNKKSHDELVRVFPELYDEMESLDSLAAVYDTQIKLYYYKNYLISLYSGIKSVPLENMKYVTPVVTKIKTKTGYARQWFIQCMDLNEKEHKINLPFLPQKEEFRVIQFCENLKVYSDKVIIEEDEH